MFSSKRKKSRDTGDNTAPPVARTLPHFGPDEVMFSVPAGPPNPPPVDPGAARETALQNGHVDARSKIHDKDSLAHESVSFGDRALDAELGQWKADAVQGRQTQAQVASLLMTQATAAAAEATSTLTGVQKQISEFDSARLTEPRARAERCRAELMGEGPYESSPWKDPARVGESVRARRVKTWLPPIVLGCAELGVNALALQILGGGPLELISFAVVLGAATIGAGHMAGVHARTHSRDGWAARLLVPAVLAVLVVCVTLFVAGLRVAFVDAPVLDPSTGQSGPSLLHQAGVGSAVVWAGIVGLQLIFFGLTSLHAHAVHNPMVAAHQNAKAEIVALEAELLALRTRLPGLEAAVSATTGRVSMAEADLERVAIEWDAHEQGLEHLAEQCKVLRDEGFARQIGDPDVTVALEARRDRNSRPAVNEADRIIDLPAAQEPHGRDASNGHHPTLSGITP